MVDFFKRLIDLVGLVIVANQGYGDDMSKLNKFVRK